MNKKKLWILLISGLVIGSFYALRGRVSAVPDKVTLFLLWEPQAQFLGYYAAESRGFFTDNGIEINIRHDLGVGDSLAQVEQKPNHFAVTQFVNVLGSLNKKPGLDVTSVISRGCNLGWLGPEKVEELLDTLERDKIRSWWGSQDILLRVLLALKNRSAGDMAQRVTNSSEATDVKSELVMTYNEALDSPLSKPGNKIHTYCGLGMPVFEDVIVTKAGATVESIELNQRFARAVWQGWDWAVKNPRDAIEILMDRHPRKTKNQQEAMFNTFSKSLIKPEDAGATLPEYFDTIQNIESKGFENKNEEIRSLSARMLASKNLRLVNGSTLK